ncbi:hypothetical protein DFH29DRAFT_1006795 [Suillus ampliporus]|nr:hypothetical protein DFH29DRAFT_1006795 [Suillus ampliporus]
MVQVPPQSIVRHSCPEYEGPSKGGANSPFNDYKHDSPCASTMANRMTHRDASSPVSPTTHTKRRASSPSLSDTGSYDSSDDDINAPLTPPPIIKSLSHYVQHAKAQRKPYERRDPSTLHRRYAATQLSPIDYRPVPDIRKGKVLLETDVEWRRVRALATAWEIQAIEEHKRFLQMVLKDDGDTYASAASEPWNTSLQELSKGSVDELNEHLHFCTAAYSPDVTSLAVGEKQLDLIEDIAHTHLGDCTAERHCMLDFTSLDDAEDHSSSCDMDGLLEVSAK